MAGWPYPLELWLVDYAEMFGGWDVMWLWWEDV